MVSTNIRKGHGDITNFLVYMKTAGVAMQIERKEEE